MTKTQDASVCAADSTSCQPNSNMAVSAPTTGRTLLIGPVTMSAGFALMVLVFPVGRPINSPFEYGPSKEGEGACS